MDWRLFLSTFALIFLAELGDKTQLVAMARAGSGDRWVVFAAASAALVCSTLIAVLAGSLLNRLVPEQAIKIASAVLFLLIGSWILFDSLRSVPAAEPSVDETTLDRARDRRLIGVVLDLALEFERIAHDDYRALAADAKDPALRRLFTELAEEEAEHRARLHAGRDHHTEVLTHHHGAEDLPASADLAHDVGDHDRAVLEHACEHEAATARFYSELARHVHIPGLRDLFAALAAHERTHLARLQALTSGDEEGR